MCVIFIKKINFTGEIIQKKSKVCVCKNFILKKMATNIFIWLFLGTVWDDYNNAFCISTSECSCKFQEELYAPGSKVISDCDEW